MKWILAHKVLAALLAVVIVGGGVAAAVFVPKALADKEPEDTAAIMTTTEPEDEITTTEAATEAETEAETTEAETTTTAAPVTDKPTTTTGPITTAKPAASLDFTQYIDSGNGLITIKGAALAPQLGLQRLPGEDNGGWHDYADAAGKTDLRCSPSGDIAIVTLGQPGVLFYGLTVGGTAPALDYFDSYGYAGRVTYRGDGVMFYLDNNDGGTGRVIYVTTDGGKIVSIKYTPRDK